MTCTEGKTDQSMELWAATTPVTVALASPRQQWEHLQEEHSGEKEQLAKPRWEHALGDPSGIWEQMAMTILGEWHLRCGRIGPYLIDISIGRPPKDLWALWEIVIGQCESWQKGQFWKRQDHPGREKQLTKSWRPVALRLSCKLSDDLFQFQAHCGALSGTKINSSSKKK